MVMRIFTKHFTGKLTINMNELFNEMQCVWFIVSPEMSFFGIACPQASQMCCDNVNL